MSRISMGAADDDMNKDAFKQQEPPPVQPPPTNEWKKVTFTKNKKKFKSKEPAPIVVPPKEEPQKIDLEDIKIEQPKLKTYKSI